MTRADRGNTYRIIRADEISVHRQVRRLHFHSEVTTERFCDESLHSLQAVKSLCSVKQGIGEDQVGCRLIIVRYLIGTPGEDVNNTHIVVTTPTFLHVLKGVVHQEAHELFLVIGSRWERSNNAEK